MGDKYYAGNGGYPVGWTGLNTPRQQVQEFEYAVLAEDDQGERIEDYLDDSQVEKLARGVQVPQGWDGIAVVPKPQKLAPLYRGRFKGFQYNQAYAHMLQLLMRYFGLRSDPGLAFGTDQDTACSKLYQKLLAQPGDYMVFAAQLGRVHPDRRLDHEMKRLSVFEVPMDGYLAVGILIANPKRLTSVDDSGISCPGAHLRDRPNRIPVLRRAGIQRSDGRIDDECLQVKHLPITEPGWMATARIPGI
ncbi:hypothetical protein HZC53_04795 [Candidatus Uhrbacteria bacterium]|nr:hypothetical protein [Candidatus Uhrbacteria bacterium]